MSTFSIETVKPALAEVARFFTEAMIPYGFFAGAAAYFHGSPRDLDDIDVLTTKEGVDAFARKYDVAPSRKSSSVFNLYTASAAIAGVDSEAVSGIEIKKEGGKVYRFDFNDEVIGRLKRIEIDGQNLWLVSAEDVVAFKSIAQREGNGKYDITDVRNILATGNVDKKIVLDKMRKCGFMEVPAFLEV